MSEPRWRAPYASGAIDAVVVVPGSKSATNRALVLGALAPGRTVLTGALHSRDTLLMAGALRVLGVPVHADPPDWVVTSPGPPFPAGGTVHVGNAGTVARFVPPLATLSAAPVHLDGDPRMRQRPLAPLLAALRTLGADLDDEGRGALPVTVRGRGRLPGGTVEVDASSSSQLVSGLLLAAPAYDAGVTVRATSPVPSAPHLAMTVRMLREAGAEVAADPQQWTVTPRPLAPRRWEVEPDLSNAAPFLAAALVTAGCVTLAGWPARSEQPGALLPDLLERMGATCARTDAGLVVRGTGSVHGLDTDLGAAGELTPVLTALAALAETPSRLRGVAHLRHQETDRLAALSREIGRLGGDVRETPDGLEIRPRPLRPGSFATYDDHRLVMAAAVLGLAVEGLQVEDAGTVAKTFPDFVPRWEAMLS